MNAPHTDANRHTIKFREGVGVLDVAPEGLRLSPSDLVVETDDEGRSTTKAPTGSWTKPVLLVGPSVLASRLGVRSEVITTLMREGCLEWVALYYLPHVVTDSNGRARVMEAGTFEKPDF